MMRTSSILINIINMSGWHSRDGILDLLGIKPQTLYAYVSRGLIAARPDPEDPRRSLYNAGDAQALAGKRARGRRARDVAQGAMAWGEAILPTRISAVEHGRLFYRERDAVRLALSGASPDEAAALLWHAPAGTLNGARPLARRDAGSPVASALATLAAEAASGVPTRGRAAAALLPEAAVLAKTVAAALGAQAGDDIAAGFAAAWGCGPEAGDLIRMALVLLADHELNTSTFAARVAASTGAPLAAALLAGFATLTGPAHGGAARRLDELCRISQETGAAAAVRGWIASGETLPGFGHPLYTQQDPRAAALLGRYEAPAQMRELAGEVETVAGLKPNIDFALLALVRAFGLPADAPLTLFAAGRTIGWLAHAMEQTATGTLIRPRAYYVGPPHEAAAEDA